jgi:hypothetical protein
MILILIELGHYSINSSNIAILTQPYPIVDQGANILDIFCDETDV